MKVINIKTRDLKKMPSLQLSRKVLNTEGKLYIYDHKDKWNHLKELIKLYYVLNDAYLVNKIYVISELLANKQYLDLPQLVLPNSLVSIYGNISGFSMPFIEDNVNLSLILNNPNVNLKQKIKYLKEIYELLEKVLNIKELENKFFLGDIYEGNFILDIDSQKVKAIDLDSSYINNSMVSTSKYLTNNQNILSDKTKYSFDEKNNPIPSRRTTNLCFMYMLINALSGEKNSYKWSKEEFYNYLSILSDLKISKYLLDTLYNSYCSTKEIEFSKQLLDSIDLTKDYTLKRHKF